MCFLNAEGRLDPNTTKNRTQAQHHLNNHTIEFWLDSFGMVKIYYGLLKIQMAFLIN